MSKLKTNQKGQAAAPFELLVAIIIMTFVIIVGTQMLNRVNEQVCINHVESEMSKFVNYLEETANMSHQGSCVSVFTVRLKKIWHFVSKIPIRQILSWSSDEEFCISQYSSKQ